MVCANPHTIGRWLLSLTTDQPPMLSFPNAKINIGLNITSKRSDGYHNIESCFYPIPWTDVLEIIPAEKPTFTSTGLQIPGNAESNLCLKAYQLLKEEYDCPPAHIHLHKVVPMGAGLGGGSADGAFTLKMLNTLFNLEITSPKLEQLAGKLGSDCPFFIDNQAKIVRGTGDQFSKCPIDLSGKLLLIKNPGIHIGTKEAYAQVVPTERSTKLDDVLQQDMYQWPGTLKNDFEASIFPNHPSIAALKKELYDLGATYASMTGSGSTVYGLFESMPSQKGFQVFTL